MSEQIEVSSRESKKLSIMLADVFAQDRATLIEEIAEVLDIEDTEVPNVEVTVTMKIGSHSISVSGLEATEKEDEDNGLFSF